MEKRIIISIIILLGLIAVIFFTKENNMTPINKVDEIIKELPLNKEQFAKVLEIKLPGPDATSTPYFTVYKTSSNNYKSIEARFNNSKNEGLIILELKTPILFSDLEAKYGQDYSILANAPGNKNTTTYTYRTDKYELSFGSDGKNVKTIIIDWTK